VIKGLEHFKDYFKEDTDKFILIGGAATILSLEYIGMSRYKATKDLDLVFVIELLDKAFIKKFLEYVRLGEYETKIANGKSQFYRFENPKNDDFPKMIEILSRKPDIFKELDLKTTAKLTVAEEVASLSALILDDNYYWFIRENSTHQDGINIASMECLVILKIRAYNDLKFKKEEGNPNVRSGDVNKHKNDVFRIAQNFNPNQRVDVTQYMKEDIKLFRENLKTDPVNLKSLKVVGEVDEILNLIDTVFEVI
jgi:hypothetical protein